MSFRIDYSSKIPRNGDVVALIGILSCPKNKPLVNEILKFKITTMRKSLIVILICFTTGLFSQTSGIKILNTNYDSYEVETKYPNETVNQQDSKSSIKLLTKEGIECRYKIKQRSELKKEYENVLNDLNSNLKLEPRQRYSVQERDSIYKSLNLLRARIEILDKEIAQLELIYNKDLIQYETVNFFGIDSKKSRAFFDLIYANDGSRFQVVNNSGFSFGDNTGSIFTELVSGNLGVLRVSLGTMISSTSSENSDEAQEAKQTEAFQRLATYGGNTVLNLEYPLAYVHSRGNQYNLITRLVAKGTADFPEFGTTTDSFAGSASFGVDLYADASLSNNELRFFMNFNINRVYGSDVFVENLGVGKSGFSFGRLTLGIVVAENIKLSFVLGSFSSEENLDNRNVILGGQILH